MRCIVWEMFWMLVFYQLVVESDLLSFVDPIDKEKSESSIDNLGRHLPNSIVDVASTCSQIDKDWNQVFWNVLKKRNLDDSSLSDNTNRPHKFRQKKNANCNVCLGIPVGLFVKFRWVGRFLKVIFLRKFRSVDVDERFRFHSIKILLAVLIGI